MYQEVLLGGSATARARVAGSRRQAALFVHVLQCLNRNTQTHSAALSKHSAGMVIRPISYSA